MLIITAKRKNAAAYQVNLSAVKNIQKEKRGIEINNDIIPAATNSLESRL